MYLIEMQRAGQRAPIPLAYSPSAYSWSWAVTEGDSQELTPGPQYVCPGTQSLEPTDVSQSLH